MYERCVMSWTAGPEDLLLLETLVGSYPYIVEEASRLYPERELAKKLRWISSNGRMAFDQRADTVPCQVFMCYYVLRRDAMGDVLSLLCDAEMFLGKHGSAAVLSMLRRMAKRQLAQVTTPLHSAAVNGRTDVVVMLLRHKRHSNALPQYSQEERCALSKAAENGHVNLVRRRPDGLGDYEGGTDEEDVT